MPIPELKEEKKQTIGKQITETNSDKSPKPLFEPIVINVPKSETPKPEVKSDENAADENAAKEKPLEPKNNEETGKPRVIIENKYESPNGETAQCKIIVSQESMSLINGGGNLGILVGFEGAGDLKELTVSSSSPDDIQVMLEPDIGAQSGKAFFVVKSISSNKGIYTVTFDAPCGKKNVPVKVR